MHWEARLRSLSSRQDGLVARWQLPQLRLTLDHWWRARRTDRWTLLTDRVLLLDGTQDTEEQVVRAAVLDTGPGSVLHGSTALAWMGLPRFDLTLSDLQVTRRRGTTASGSSLARVHRLRALHHTDVQVIRGIPTISPLRAIWSEASRYAPEKLRPSGEVAIGRLLDDANRMGLLTWEELHFGVRRLGVNGRAGTVLLRGLLDDRQPGTAPTESRLEDRFLEVAGRVAPTLAAQVWVGGRRPIGRVDFQAVEVPLVVEVNSITFHTTPSDRRSDESRYADLVAAGFTVVVVWEPDLWRAHDVVREAVVMGRRAVECRAPVVVHTASCPWPHDPTRVVVTDANPATHG